GANTEGAVEMLIWWILGLCMEEKVPARLLALRRSSQYLNKVIKSE
ncbi:hypothetical protein A2U01_0069101, partial [Trifolium medium]|nr:hypothetical protein [Trifolium medium]